MPPDEIDSRRAAVRVQLADRKLDGFLIGNGPNLRYLTGFTGSNGMLLLTRDSAVFFTDPRYRMQSAQEVNVRVRVSTGPLLPDAVKEIAKGGVRRLAFEQGRTTYETYQTLTKSLPMKTELAPLASRVEQNRMIKSDAEIARIRRSVETNSRTFAGTIAHVRPGVREIDLAARMEYRMRRLGAEKPAFETIVAAGERSAWPHAHPTTARLANGDLVVVDMGAMQDGYTSDMTRMLFIGSPSAKVKRTYNAVLEAQLAAIAAVKPGISAARVDAAARRVLKAHGLDRAFVHSTGHGLGLEIHEPPRVGKKDKTKLQKNMVITIEPGVYLEGFGGIRIEDTVLVTSQGCEILTPTAKELVLV